MSLKSKLMSARGALEKIFSNKMVAGLFGVMLLSGVIFGVVKLVGATSANDRVSVDYGDPINYGWGWSTNHFYVSGATVPGGQVSAMCGDPQSRTAYGDATVVDPMTLFPNDTGGAGNRILQIKRVMLVTDRSYDSNVYDRFLSDHDNFWTDLAAYDDYLVTETDSQTVSYTYGHIIVGRLFSESGWYDKIDDDDAEQYEAALNEINSWFEQSAQANIRVNDYQLFAGVMDTTGQQRILWMEAPQEKYAKIRVKKVDTFGEVLKGAQFTLYERGSTNAEHASDIKTGWTTRANGFTTWSEELPLDGKRYCVVETKAPAGYMISEAAPKCSKAFTEANYGSSLVWEVQFEDSEILEPDPYGGVKIQKRDAETANATQGNATLAGAEFTVYDESGTAVATVVTEYLESAGTYVGENDVALPAGTYTIKETKAPKGYNLNTEWEKTCTIVNDGDVCSYTGNNSAKDTVIKGGIEIEKKDKTSGAAMPGISFEIYENFGDKNLVRTFTTDSDGKYVMPEADYLPYGSYKLHEVANEANAGYMLMGDKTFTIKANGITSTNTFTGTKALVNTPNEDIQFVSKLRDADSTLSDPVKTVGIGWRAMTDRVEFTEGHLPLSGRRYRIEAMVFGQRPGSSTWEMIRNIPDEDYIYMEQDMKGADLAQSGYYELNPVTVDTTEYAGGKLTVGVVMYAYENGSYSKEVFRHNMDTSASGFPDADETVTVEAPEYEISTQACRGGTSGTSCKSDVGVGVTTVADRVDLNGLIPGRKYVVKGKAVCYESGATSGTTMLEKNSEVINASGRTASTTIEYEIDTATCGAGKKVGIVNELHEDTASGTTLVTHNADLSDAKESVLVLTPSLVTTATSGGAKTVALGANANVDDKISYTGLVQGTSYCLAGQLMSGTTKVTEATVSFIATGETGSQDMTFTFNSETYEGKSLTVNEYLYRGSCEGGTRIAKHENGEGQTVTVAEKVPAIGTQASNETKESNILQPTTGQVIIDTVNYYNLKVGQTYTLFGDLMKSATEKLSETTTGIKITFTPTTRDGKIEMVFPAIDATKLAGQSLVVFERLYLGEVETEGGTGTPIASHEDFNDGNQAVIIKPKVGTKVAESRTGEAKVGIGNAIIVDTVAYEGLIMGQTYTAKGWLVGPDGQKISGSEGTTTFKIGDEKTPETSGKVEVNLSLKTVGLGGKKVVAYEEVYLGSEIVEEHKVAEHKDINDPGQTVDVEDPVLRTIASDKADGDKELAVSSEATIIDRVEYGGLVIGSEYCIKGVLMDKESEKAVTVTEGSNVGNIESSKCFVAERTEGYEDLEFKFDASKYGGKVFVVFETLYLAETDGGKKVETEIAKHHNINDTAQTVTIKLDTPETGSVTRDDSGAKVVLAGLSGAVIIGVCGYGIYLKGSKKKYTA